MCQSVSLEVGTEVCPEVDGMVPEGPELETEPGGQPGSPQADAQMGAGGGPGHGLLQVPGDVRGPVAPRGGPRGRGRPRGCGICRGQP